MNTNTNTQVKRYKKSVIELYQEAVESTIETNIKVVAQFAKNGNEYKGLNKLILSKEAEDKGFISNVWFSKKAMEEANMIQKSEEDFGVILFSTKLKNIPNSTKKEKIITYYRVFNKDSLEVIPV